MTLDETTKTLAYIASAYPRYFANVTDTSWKTMSIVWSETFAEYSAESVMTGVRAYISADMSGFPPSPGQIIGYIHTVGNPADHSGTEAWALVRRAVNVPWDQFEASFNTLPRAVQVAVGSPDSLKELAQMDTQRFETVAQSNFLRMYDATIRREKTEDRFSGAVIGARQMVAKELMDRAMQRNPTMIENKAGNEQKQITEQPQRERVELSGNTEDMIADLRRRLGGGRKES